MHLTILTVNNVHFCTHYITMFYKNIKLNDNLNVLKDQTFLDNLKVLFIFWNGQCLRLYKSYTHVWTHNIFNNMYAKYTQYYILYYILSIIMRDFL